LRANRQRPPAARSLERDLGPTGARLATRSSSAAPALIHVDGLKAVNDNHGHASGDALLRDVAAAITSRVRSYDFAVRLGGDEFACGVSDVTLEVTSERLGEIQCALTALHPGASISAALAELTDDDTLESLIARPSSSGAAPARAGSEVGGLERAAHGASVCSTSSRLRPGCHRSTPALS
jgi:diguanylate cyclase (GGDEF)-like protein